MSAERRGALSAATRRRVLVRLALVAAVLMTVLGAATLILEAQGVKRFILANAIDEGREFALRHPWARDVGPQGDPAEVQRALMDFMASRSASPLGHFVVARVYGPDGNLVAAMRVDDGAETAADHLVSRDGWAPFDVMGEGPIYLPIAIPWVREDGTPLGSLQGVYHLPESALEAIRNDVYLALLQVAAAVALTAGVLYPVILSLNREALSSARRLVDANIDTLDVLGSAMSKRDETTGSHNYRVTLYAIGLGEALGLAPQNIRRLIKGAMLHDVGKIAVPDAVLLKEGTLAEGEFTVMRGHVAHGVEIVERSAWLAEGADVVAYHHERWDGQGYPRGLKGEQIPINARIFAVVDVFDALTSQRPYKEVWPLCDAMVFLEKERGRQFDPHVLDAFEAIAPRLHARWGGRDEEDIADEAHEIIGRYLAEEVRA